MKNALHTALVCAFVTMPASLARAADGRSSGATVGTCKIGGGPHPLAFWLEERRGTRSTMVEWLHVASSADQMGDAG